MGKTKNKDQMQLADGCIKRSSRCSRVKFEKLSDERAGIGKAKIKDQLQLTDGSISGAAPAARLGLRAMEWIREKIVKASQLQKNNPFKRQMLS